MESSLNAFNSIDQRDLQGHPAKQLGIQRSHHQPPMPQVQRFEAQSQKQYDARQAQERPGHFGSSVKDAERKPTWSQMQKQSRGKDKRGRAPTKSFDEVASRSSQQVKNNGAKMRPLAVLSSMMQSAADSTDSCQTPGIDSEMSTCDSMQGVGGPMQSMKEQLEALRTEDSKRVIIARRINKLGFQSADILRAHLTRFGQVKDVLVSHTRYKCFVAGGHKARENSERLRAAGLGFIIMEQTADAIAILEQGADHNINGITVQLSAFHPFERGAGGERSEQCQPVEDSKPQPSDTKTAQPAPPHQGSGYICEAPLSNGAQQRWASPMCSDVSDMSPRRGGGYHPALQRALPLPVLGMDCHPGVPVQVPTDASSAVAAAADLSLQPVSQSLRGYSPYGAQQRWHSPDSDAFSSSPTRTRGYHPQFELMAMAQQYVMPYPLQNDQAPREEFHGFPLNQYSYQQHGLPGRWHSPRRIAGNGQHPAMQSENSEAARLTVVNLQQMIG